MRFLWFLVVSASLRAVCSLVSSQVSDLERATALYGPISGSNAAAIVTCGSVPQVTVVASGNDYVPSDPDTYFQASWNVWDNQIPYCTALLANGCIMDTNERWGRMAVTPAVPSVCPPVGLGRRFLSVLRGLNYYGGVTDTGNIVLMGYATNWDKCVFIQGPFTPMATVLKMTSTGAAGLSTISVPTGIDLCALDAAGVLHCWADLPSTWAASAFSRRWIPTGPFDGARPSSACMDITGNGTFLRPSPRMCPAAAAAVAARAVPGAQVDCVAPYTLASFSVTGCHGRPSHIVGVRAADKLPLAWMLGVETWEAAPPTPPNSTAVGPLGIFVATGDATPVDHRFAPQLRCGDGSSSRNFIGRAADGTFFEEPEVREVFQQAAGRRGRRNLTAAAARVIPLPSMRNWSRANFNSMWGYQASTMCGPFSPFAAAPAASREDTSCGGCGFHYNPAGTRVSDGSVQMPLHGERLESAETAPIMMLLSEQALATLRLHVVFATRSLRFRSCRALAPTAGVAHPGRCGPAGHAARG